ncbi:MAG: hypothetical protein COX16_11355 [Deltaproteobacteria bacterium CG23_combo_of_CG06-09_8_20_14_all_51_20]|nr:hypothetical protein [bacterium]NCP09102.1 hypothetical protein [bacterium]OIP40420.1 MAG: hypothetical protein AUK25_07760 [Desulfobacteraceae bacterium CG2_30_51_40]PIP45797.1 MAG: hypothetical protein COX16_11355 [Deltaproteobacteria bacterium CG23_combo_of_CG06-09_8_20_14_all_51_20]PJB36357.1 MAG: hypothetical protein CO107_07910 [Deltaproteobacteria bacterium CG_4_9_14_3_um_filter_51_14]
MDIVAEIGKRAFEWMTTSFDKTTTLADIPDELLGRLAAVDVTIRDYQRDAGSIAAIAMLTFAYRLGGRTQSPQDGPRDITLLKVLCKEEIGRRTKATSPSNPMWNLPLYEIIAGEVGQRLRKARIPAGGQGTGVADERGASS